MKGKYEFYIDISGTLKKTEDDIFVGCILINNHFITSFKEKFYNDFKSLRSFRKKGSYVHPDKLKEIMKFMDDNNIKRSVVVLKRYIIKKIKRDLEKKIRELKKIKGNVQIKDFEERLIGLAYFRAIKEYALKNFYYNCYCCMETQFNIQGCFVSIDRISHKEGYKLRVSAIPRRTEHMIKFADFCASAGRKLDSFILKSYKKMRYISYVPSEREIDVVFGLSRREKTKYR